VQNGTIVHRSILHLMLYDTNGSMSHSSILLTLLCNENSTLM